VRYIVPLVLLWLLYFQVRSDLLVNYGIFVNYSKYPSWALGVFGIGVVVIPIIAAFFMPRRILDRR